MKLPHVPTENDGTCATCCEPWPCREGFAAMPGPAGRLVLPCGPDRGCDYEECVGWTQVRDDSFDLRHWTPTEIAEARAFGLTEERP